MQHYLGTLQTMTCLPGSSIPDRCYQLEFEIDFFCKKEKMAIKLNGVPLSPLCEVKQTFL